MTPPSIPDNESERLAALRRYEILDTPPEAEFDDFTRVASQICGAPISLITLVDEARQWFKSRIGIEINETPRTVSFCAHAIHGRRVFEVANAAEDERFADNPLVSGDPRIRFYAGAPLVTPEGQGIGTLCVIDTVPRRLTPEQRDSLERLGRRVVAQLEMRLAANRLQQSEAQLRDFLDSSSDLIQSVAPDGRFLFVNRAWRETLGFSEEEIAGLNVFDIVHPEHREHCSAVFQRLMRGETVGLVEAAFVSKDGRRVEVEGRVNVRIEHGQPVATQGIFRDTTTRRQAELARRESEERFTRLFHVNPVASTLCEIATGEFLDVNSEFLTLLGRPREEVVGRDSIALGLWGADESARAVLVEKLLRNEPVSGVERPVSRPDGSTVWFSAAARLVKLGGRDLVLSTFVDVTARREAEKKLHDLNTQLERRVEERTAELRQQEEFDRLLLENLSEGVVACDAECRLTLFNRTAREWHSKDSSSIPPEQWADHYHLCEADGRTRLAKDQIPLIRAFHGEHFRNVEMSIFREGVPTRFVLASGAPLFDAAGNKRGAVVVMHDVTESRKAERQNLRTQRLEAIGTLAGGVAHDLNNALAPIMMSVELLRMQYPGQSQMMDTIASSAKRGADMVRQLLTFAKGAEGERVLIQPSHVVREMQNIIRGTFPKNIQLQVNCDKKLPTVLGDATQIHQILLNLCVNARDAMPHGGTLVLEAVSQDVDAAYASSSPEAKPGKYVALQVRDSGTGIPPEILDRIFDPFFTTKGPDKGTGLGLSTVMGIVKGHGGFLQVQSQPGRGSTFTAYLPAASAGSDTEQFTKPETTFRGQEETVLLVDDEAAVRDMGRAVLRRLNFKPLTATDGADGLVQAAENRTKLRAVITDLHMPHMDGLAFVRALRRMLPDIPVVVTSGRMDEASAGEFKTLNVTSRLDKPFTETQLAEALRNLLAPK